MNLVPRHIAVIPDGNRRFARKEGKPAIEGHRYGYQTFKNILVWCKDHKIQELSIWAFSTENFKRDKAEVEFLFKFFEQLCDEVLKEDSQVQKNDMRVSFLGAKHLLPSSLQKKMMEVEAATKNNTSFKLNLLVAYGGREEILSAVKKLLKEKDLKPEELTEESFKKYLYLESEPDLIIRTGHACLSGLLPWQSIYSEIIFLEDKYWPEFSKQDFEHCLSEFSKRRRSFGK